MWIVARSGPGKRFSNGDVAHFVEAKKSPPGLFSALTVTGYVPAAEKLLTISAITTAMRLNSSHPSVVPQVDRLAVSDSTCDFLHKHFASPLGLGLGCTYPIPGGGAEIKGSPVHTSKVSDGQRDLHHDQAIPMFDGVSFSLPLPLLGREVVGEFPGSKLDIQGGSDAQGQENDAGEIGVTVRMRGEVFLIGHAKQSPITPLS